MVDSQVITVPPTIQDITGQKFGRLTVIRYAGKVPNNDHRWRCVCECGTEKPIRHNCLLSGKTSSCGCYKKERINASKRNRRHGMWGTPTWNSWDGMISRCTNPANASYANYGGRGITVCDKWKTFEGFFSDMGIREEGCELDRIDTNGNYSPANCRWVTVKQQMRNKRNNRMVTFNGETLCVAEWEERFGVNRDVIYARLRAGWDAALAVSQPAHKYTRKST